MLFAPFESARYLHPQCNAAHQQGREGVEREKVWSLQWHLWRDAARDSVCGPWRELLRDGLLDDGQGQLNGGQ